MHGFWEEMDRLGKERNPYRAGFLQSVGVAESREEAMRLYREPAEYFYGRCLRVDPHWAMPPGYITEATQRAGIVGQIGRAESLQARQAARAMTRMEDIVERGYVIIGSPDEVVAQLTELAQDLNVGHLMLLMQFGSMNKDLAAYNTKLSPSRYCQSCAACSANGRTNGGRSRCPAPNAPRCRPFRCPSPNDGESRRVHAFQVVARSVPAHSSYFSFHGFTQISLIYLPECGLLKSPSNPSNDRPGISPNKSHLHAVPEDNALFVKDLPKIVLYYCRCSAVRSHEICSREFGTYYFAV
jgi:hypothetical protein